MTFMHDSNKLAAKEYEKFRTIVALALLHNSPDPRNLCINVAKFIVGSECKWNRCSQLIPIYEIQEKVVQIENETDPERLSVLLNAFEERFDVGFNKVTSLYSVMLSRRGSTVLFRLAVRWCTRYA